MGNNRTHDGSKVGTINGRASKRMIGKNTDDI
jgi:hypothetical protein